MVRKLLTGTPCEGSPHMQFNEREVALAIMPKRDSLLCPKLMAVIATTAALLSSGVYAADYTWMASPADAHWNTTSLNWNSGVAWVDGSNAIFPVSSGSKSITIDGTRTAADVTLNGTGYTLTGALNVTGKFTLVTGSCTVPNGFSGDSIHIGGPSSATVYMNKATYQALQTGYLEDSITLATSDRRCFGPDPDVPSTNIVINGDLPSIYANGNVNLCGGGLGRNRIIRIVSGKSMKLGSKSGCYLRLGPIVADASPGCDFSTNTYVYVTNGWAGTVRFDPGSGVTNDVGRLEVDGILEIESGVTRLGSSKNNALTNSAPLYVRGGNLTILGGELYIPQSSRYVDIRRNAQVNILGGRFKAPGAEILIGVDEAGSTLSVSNGGEFVVGALRLGQKARFNNVINLGRNGIIRSGGMKIGVNNSQDVAFNFDGGRVQSDVSNDGSGTLFNSPTDANWDGVKFYVLGGGAVLDSSSGKHVWWARPLISGTEHDGGLTCRLGSNKDVVMHGAAICTYNGPTRTVGRGNLQVRVANALPASTTLQIGPNTGVGFNSNWTSKDNDVAQTVACVEGCGTVTFNTKLVVTSGISPVFDGNYGTLTFNYACSLSGDYVISCDATGCGCVKVAAGQDISNLVLKLANPSALDKDADRTAYKILDAPYGFTGKFTTSADWPSDWYVRYASDGKSAYLCRRKGFVISFL